MTRHGRGGRSEDSQKIKTKEWVKRPEGYTKTMAKFRKNTGTLTFLILYKTNEWT
jgi:hypothetical protein